MSTYLLSRRAVMEGGSTALILGMVAQDAHAAKVPEVDGTLRMGAHTDDIDVHLNAWIRIASDGTITLRVGAAEMGQGVFTALPMILAEELDADWDAVRVEAAPVDAAFRRDGLEFPGTVQATGGSSSVRGYWTFLRNAGAAARAMLVRAAAQAWGVRPEDCTTERSVVRSGDRSATYGSLVRVAATMPVPNRPALKEASAFRLIGTSPPRVDLPAKVDGSSPFGIDVSRPGMLVATVRWCPHYGGRIATVDDAAARAMPGVVDIFPFSSELDYGEAVVVVATSFYRARLAAETVNVTWDKGPGAGLDDTTIDGILKDALDNGNAKVVHKVGSFAPENAGLVAEYAVPYLEHAPIEPLNATVHITPERCDVWAGVQNQQGTHKLVMQMTGLPAERVFVHSLMLGGGFGRRSESDAVEVAVAAALRTSKPVKVIYTREQVFARGGYRPVVRARMQANWSDGRLLGWSTHLASQNPLSRSFPAFLVRSKLGRIVVYDGFHRMPYSVPNQLVRHSHVELPILVGWWRSVHGSHNGFFRECFLDEVAHSMGQDPIALRQDLLTEAPRAQAVFAKLLENAGPVPEGQHRGVAIFESFEAICAQAVDVSVDGGKVTLHRLTAVIDAGLVVHPDSVKAQVMGAATMGLSAALGERLSFADGAVVQSNFHEYPLISLGQTPLMDVSVMPSAEPPGGVGEPGLPPAPAALCNAIFAATGRRIRTLPIGNQLSG